MSEETDDEVGYSPAGTKEVKTPKKKKPEKLKPVYSGINLAFDTETTGIGPKFNRITEIALLEFNPETGETYHEEEGRYFHTFINPEQEVPPEVVAVHGMTWEMLKAYPTFKEIMPALIKFIQGVQSPGKLTGPKIVAHNAPFDVSFINEEFKRAKLEGFEKLELADICFEVEDTLSISRKNVISKKHKLDNLADRYGIDRSRRILHDARGDCILLAEVYPALMADVAKNIEAISKVLPFALGDTGFDESDLDLVSSRYMMLQTLGKLIEKDANIYLAHIKEAAQGSSQQVGEDIVIDFSNRTKTDWKQMFVDIKHLLPEDFDMEQYQTQSSAISVKYL